MAGGFKPSQNLRFSAGREHTVVILSLQYDDHDYGRKKEEQARKQRQ